MSLELGGKDKSILYLNLIKSGEESLNDPVATHKCTVSANFAQCLKPFVQDQSKYLCAVTRFSVPLVEVPIINPTHFDIYQYEDAEFEAWRVAQGLPVIPPPTNGEEELASVELYALRKRLYFNTVVEDAANAANHHVARINTRAHYTFYEFMDDIAGQLQYKYAQSFYNVNTGDPDRRVTDTLQMAPPNVVMAQRFISLSERIKMTISNTLKFKIQVTDDLFTKRWYVKLSNGMFNMLQFNQTPAARMDTRNMHPHSQLIDRRFLSVMPGNPAGDIADYDMQHLHLEHFVSQRNQRGGQVNDAVSLASYMQQRQSNAARYAPLWVTYTGTMCCADCTRLREVVFLSDMDVKSEGGNGANIYKRFLCDYQLFNPTQINYNIKNCYQQDPYDTANQERDYFLKNTTSYTEELPAHRYYVSNNASGGRWQELINQTPLYDIEVRAMVKVWDYEHQRYEFEDIPLPAGAQYSVKLIFVSKENQAVAIMDNPDKYHV